MEMSELHTTITTAALPKPVSERLVTELREFFPDATGGEVEQLSPSPPAWVEIIASLATWKTVLGIGASAYVAQLAKRLADDHWDNRARYRKEVIAGLGKALDRLRQFVGCFARAGNSIHRRLGVQLGVQELGSTATKVSAALDSEEELLETTALFVHYLPGVAKAVQTIYDEHGDPMDSEIWCRLLRDGFQLAWFDQDSQKCQEVFEADGSPRLGKTLPSPSEQS